MKAGFIGRISLLLVIIACGFMRTSEAGSKRRLNSSKGLPNNNGRGIHGFYDDPTQYDEQAPIVHRDSDNQAKESSKATSKDKDVVGRTCPDATLTVTPSIFDLSTLFGTGTGTTGEWFGISAGIIGIAIVIAVIWIKVVVAAFIAWVWWAGYGFGGGKNGGNEGGYSYSSGSSAYGAPVQQTSYGAPVQQASYGSPQPQYGSPTSAYTSRSLSDSFNFETISGYILKAIDAFTELHESNTVEGTQAKKTS